MTERKTKRRLALLLLGMGLMQGATAQLVDPNAGYTVADIPDARFVTTDYGSAVEVDKKLNGILQFKTGEIMNGLEDYATSLTDIAIDKLKDELIKMIADMMPIGSAAEKIISVYQKKKDSALADAIDRIKAITKKAQNTQLKSKFQNLKINYARMEAKWKTMGEISGGPVGKLATATDKQQWGEHVANLDEYWNDPQTRDITKYLYPELDPNAKGNLVDYGWISSVTTGGLMQDSGDYVKLMNTISDKEYDNDDTSVDRELVAYSAYDRLMMKRAALKRAQQNINYSRVVGRTVNRYVQEQLRKTQRKQLNASVGGVAGYGSTNP